ncbi:aspartate-semialdehyde dehydrogenase [Stutzerimonas stutzeri]|uniref:aspartate-semialdehyde dehydrogenase n=1 Tax=Stutzerimonas sp. S1 TaxID=3030652 RepID=UPI002225695F|nr:aspartate-semialdehyde dehydrogenase [Stutzerimonas sp. S1]MCW3148869.1 aspartate-semialdehyde dehydrogenase [Stutzerimonas sp. S1]
MATTVDVAVVGAASLGGEAIVEMLEERDFPVGQLYLLDSADLAGQTQSFRGSTLRVRAADAFEFAGVGLVFLLGDRALAAACFEQAEQAGCLVVDLSGARDLSQVPCVVPEVNSSMVPPRCIASPSPESVALATALAPFRSVLNIERVTVTACVPVSGRGRAGVNELARQAAELLNGRPLEPRFFDRQIAFNLLARVEEPDERGQTAQERRTALELQFLLGGPALRLALTFMQVPVFFGESFSVSLVARGAVDLEAVLQALDRAPGVELAAQDDYPTVVGDAVGQDVVFIGRVRKGMDDPAELNLWIVSDNVRKGTAWNAVLSAELLIKHYL